jgi:serine/threonine protein kinase
MHRDVKPDNLLVVSIDPAARVNCKLTDFGTTRAGGEKERQYTKGIGTPTYMAPEILREEGYSNKADVYSFAILAWYMMERKDPYGEFASMWAIAEFVITGKRLELPECELKRCIGDIVISCWAAQPSERPEFSVITKALKHVESERMQPR